MELTGKLKDQVAHTKSLEEAKDIIESSGMKLTDDELDSVTGGAGFIHAAPKYNRDWHELSTFDDPRMGYSDVSHHMQTDRI